MVEEYVEEDEENQIPGSRQDQLLWAVVIVIAALLWFVFSGRWGTSTFDTAHFSAVALIGGFAILQGGMLMFKNRTPKILMDYKQSHFTMMVDDFRQVGRWGIVRLGGTMAMGFHSHGRSGTVVAPYDSFVSVGGNSMVCTSKIETKSPSRLPLGIRKYLTDNKYPMPILFGIFSSEQLKDPSNVALQETMEQNNLIISSFEDSLKKLMDKNEDVLSWARRLSGQDSLSKSLKNWAMGTKRSEEGEY